MDEVDPLGGDVPDGLTRIKTGSGRIRLITEWRTDDPGLAQSLRDLMAMPEHSAERHEALAGLHMLQARWEWRDADRLRDQARANERREQRLAASRADDGRRHVVHATCSVCSTVVRVNLDGMVRAHVHGTAGGWRSTKGRDGRRCDGSGKPPVA